jgi:hypothetical protein
MDLNNVLTINEKLDFTQALKEVLKDKKIHKLEWEDKEYYGVLRNNKLQIHKPDGNFHDWIISEPDLIGEDYIIL